MAEKKIQYAFRLTHIDNIPHILEYGLVKADSLNANPNYVPIGDQFVIEKRKNRLLETSSWKKIGDFIPFYFGPRSPMLYVIQHGYNGVRRVEADKIVYCVIRLDDIIRDGIDCFFTDGHALSGLTQVFPGNLLNRVDEYVQYNEVFAYRWDDDENLDLKRRKEAELLLVNDLPVEYIKGFVVYNLAAKQLLLSMGIDDRKVVVKANYYF
jgi:hypothetical protein